MYPFNVTLKYVFLFVRLLGLHGTWWVVSSGSKIHSYSTYWRKTHPLLGSRAIPLGWVIFSLRRTILLRPFSLATSIVLSLESNQYKLPPIQSYASPSTRSRPFDITWNNQTLKYYCKKFNSTQCILYHLWQLPYFSIDNARARVIYTKKV